MEEYKIAVDYRVCGTIKINAESFEKALEYAEDSNPNDVEDGEYLEDSWMVNKELSKSFIMNMYLKAILTKMCDMVNVKFDEIDFKGSDWYLKHEWSKEQQDEFSEWLQKYLNDGKIAWRELTNMNSSNKKNRKRFANEFIFQYGWKQKDD